MPAVDFAALLGPSYVPGLSLRDRPPPTVRGRLRLLTIRERFLLLCAPAPSPRGCWLWTGEKDRDGYARFNVQVDGVPRHLRGSRAAWTLHTGRNPHPKLEILHRCDTPACVAPAHLHLGTRRQNAIDAVVKGRNPRGTMHGMAKLTEETVRAIRASYTGIRGDKRRLARVHGVDESTIGEVLRGNRWAHVR